LINSCVSVFHPGRQHSHQLAKALDQKGLLFEYWTGVPTQTNLLIKHFIKSHPVGDINQNRVVFLWISTFFYYLSLILRWGGKPNKKLIYFGDSIFDWMVSLCVDFKKNQVVVGYENACLRIFKKAKTAGCLCVLDAASVHYKMQDRYLGAAESKAFHQKTIKRKEEETSLADYVFTVSSLAKKSYIADGGLPEEKVESFSLGADISFFTRGSKRENKPMFEFLFSGAIRPLKGVDLLLGAIAKVSEKRTDFTVIFAGGNGNVQNYIENQTPYRYCRFLGHLKPEDLRQVYQQSDCLVLPSRFDSFGMVVPEALACGTPVIVTDRVGAKEMVKEGANGWVIPAESVDALAEKMLWCLEHQVQVRSMAKACRKSAEDNDWSVYYSRVGTWFEKLLLENSASIQRKTIGQ